MLQCCSGGNQGCNTISQQLTSSPSIHEMPELCFRCKDAMSCCSLASCWSCFKTLHANHEIRILYENISLHEVVRCFGKKKHPKKAWTVNTFLVHRCLTLELLSFPPRVTSFWKSLKRPFQNVGGAAKTVGRSTCTSSSKCAKLEKTPRRPPCISTCMASCCTSQAKLQ